MSFADRLREVVRPGPPHHLRQGDGGPPADDVADVLDGQWQEAAGHRFLVVDRRYSPGYRHGNVSVADCLPSSDGWPGLDMLAGKARDGGLLFLDLETTGLAGGAGTYAFLIGCGWFEPPPPSASASQGAPPSASASQGAPPSASASQPACFRVRQFLLSNFAAERALLDAVAELARGATTLVTYNGKTFDVPLMETRYMFQRLATPFADLPHIDMLHPARRLWRAASEDGSLAGSCRLITLEHGLLGHERDGDVPAFEIPSRYFHFVRTADARPLQAVLEHNRLDLVSLAMLTARLTRLLGEGPAAASNAREALGLGRLYERAEREDDARECFARASALPADTLTRAEALRALAIACRRERRFEEAAAAWRQIVELRRCPARLLQEAIEALAVHHEHRVRDLVSARQFAMRSLSFPGNPRRTQAIHHRLARLNRKMDDARLPEWPTLPGLPG